VKAERAENVGFEIRFDYSAREDCIFVSSFFAFGLVYDFKMGKREKPTVWASIALFYFVFPFSLLLLLCLIFYLFSVTLCLFIYLFFLACFSGYSNYMPSASYDIKEEPL
jgi:hypothetical protein